MVYPVRIGFNLLAFSTKNRAFELNCITEKDMDVRASAVVDGVAECFNGSCFCLTFP